MFTLLHPSALLALSGLLVPVAIHLWNRRPGREVAVGSLRWLAAGANRRLRNLKLEQLWLLLLRAALLAVLAVAVAAPVWRQAQPVGRGLVLLQPESIKNPAFNSLRPAIDSLRRRGYVLRWLARDFPRVPGTVWQANGGVQRTDSLPPTGRLGSDWARVQQATSVFSGQPIYVVAPAVLRNLAGTHPSLPANVTWQTLPITTTKTWLQAAALRADSLRLMLGQSTENQTVFRLLSMAMPRPGAALRVAGLAPMRLELGTSNRQPTLRSLADSAQNPALPIAVNIKPLRVIIYSTTEYAPDARYLQAGLRAAATGLPLPLALTTTPQQPDPATPPDWLFWLSDAPLPAAWHPAVRQGSRIWQEAAGPGTPDTAFLATTGVGSTAIFRRDALPKSGSPVASIWSDGQGRAVLTRHAFGRGAFYQLHTRLHPSWSALPDDPTLPERLLKLLQPELTDEQSPSETALDQQLAVYDQRAIDPTQLFHGSPQPAKNVILIAGNVAPLAFRQTDLRPWLVLAAGLLFLFERLLARRRETGAFPSSIA